MRTLETTVEGKPPLKPYDFSHLSVGDFIEVRRSTVVYHSGTISEAMPEQGVFWIRDDVTGLRRIVDFDSFDIWVAKTNQQGSD